jgi:hypothetical protein
MMSRFECDASFVIQFLSSSDFMCWTIKDDGGLVPVRWEKLLEDHDLIRNVLVSRRVLA